MKVALAISALALVLALPATAAATANSPPQWYWSQGAAANHLIDNMNTSDDEEVVDATCVGISRPWKRPGVWLFHRLRCDETDDLGRDFTVLVIPTSRYHARVTEINCDDLYSEYACPE
jgi:hypothetical protein